MVEDELPPIPDRFGCVGVASKVPAKLKELVCFVPVLFFQGSNFCPSFVPLLSEPLHPRGDQRANWVSVLDHSKKLKRRGDLMLSSASSSHSFK